MDRKGNPPLYPNLLNLSQNKEELIKTILHGKGVMPAFTQLNDEQMSAVAEFLMSDELGTGTTDSDADSMALMYTLNGYSVLKDRFDAPIISPPWGVLNAIDLAKGTIRWRVSIG